MEAACTFSVIRQSSTWHHSQIIFGFVIILLIAVSASMDNSTVTSTRTTTLPTDIKTQQPKMTTVNKSAYFNMKQRTRPYTVKGRSPEFMSYSTAKTQISETSSPLENTSCDGLSSPCGINQRCTYTAKGEKKCDCIDGYKRSGINCWPINPCDFKRGGCESGTNCRHSGPNQHVCECKYGYENYVPGVGCTLKDFCTNTSCGPNSVCKTLKAGSISCPCINGYKQNGTFCVGNMLERFRALNEYHPQLRHNLLYIINLSHRFFADLLTGPGPFTFFVPTDQAFRNVIGNGTEHSKLLDDDDRIKQILRQHILLGEFKIFQSILYTLQGNIVNLNRRASTYKLAGDSTEAKIAAQYIIASNGLIYPVDTLLTFPPHYQGDKKKTLMDLIKQEVAYDKFYTMIMSAGLSEVFSQPNITVFIPENIVWNALPDGTLDYLLNDDEGQIKLKVILKNHIFPGMITVTDLIKKTRITSLANITTEIRISYEGQILLDNKVGISQVNLAHISGVYYHVRGLIVPSYIGKILPNKCMNMKEITVSGICQECDVSLHGCYQSTDKPTEEFQHCLYDRHWPYHRHWPYDQHWPSRRPTPGCERKCLRNIKTEGCCDGFAGPLCELCPGGFKNPCNGNGKCAMISSGDISCQCHDSFTGTACELCTESNTFGPYCNESCTCKYGECNTGPQGTGKCKNETCQLGYTGENCDIEQVPCESASNPCSDAYVACFLDEKNIPSCMCDQGYKDVGDECMEIDRCETDNGGCHQQATCSNSPNSTLCVCNTGWTGDGYFCSPLNPCTSHASCSINSTCHNSEPGQYYCVCKTGYSGDGQTCTLVDPCVEKNGGCHPQATCTMVQDGGSNCTCPETMEGNGKTCYRTISGEIMVHPDLTWLASMMQIVSDLNNIFDKPDNNLYTLFAPSDAAMKTFMTSNGKWNGSTYWKEEQSILWFLKFHTLRGAISAEDMIALEEMVNSYPTLFHGFSLHIISINNTVYVSDKESEYASLVVPDIPAINGYIHIIDKVLEPFAPNLDKKLHSLTEELSSQAQYKLFFLALQESGVLEQINQLDEYTVFVLTNDAMRKVNRRINAEFLKYYIVPRVLISLSIRNDDTVDTLLGQQHRLSFTLSNSTVFVNGMKITRLDILTFHGVIHELNGPIHPVLNRCDFNHSAWEIGDCSNCTTLENSCPPDYVPKSKMYECSMMDDSHTTIQKGCQPICIYTSIVRDCCGGFFGTHCNECPGGADNACSGNGACDDGEKGSGQCTCDKGFAGASCDHCESPDLVPPYCNVTYSSCGYMNGNCSELAVCTETSIGVLCRCPEGYFGDGSTCTPLCQLQDNGGCHPQARCSFNTSAQIRQCTCMNGFHGNGTWCQQNIEVCTQSNSQCDLMRADCIFPVPKVTDMVQGSPSCDCLAGYIGDGKLCSTNMMDAVSRIPELDNVYFWLKKKKNSKMLQLLSNYQLTITVFVSVADPVDSSSLIVVEGEFKLPRLQNSRDNDISSHLHEQWTFISQSGQVINITVDDQEQFHANGVRIVRPNVETLNGMLHLTEKSIVSSADIVNKETFTENSTSSAGTSSHADIVNKETFTEKSTSSHIDIIVACVVAVLAVVVLVSAVIIYMRKRNTRNLLIMNNAANKNLSLSRLISEDNQNEAAYRNPLFNN